MTGKRFDALWPLLSSQTVVSAARFWGAGKITRKGDAVDILRAVFGDPALLRKGVARLAEHERTALALLNQAGGACDSDALAAAVFASGILSQPGDRRGSGLYDVIRRLAERGLIMSSNSHDPGYLGDNYGMSTRVEVFTDERLLAYVGTPQVVPFAIEPAAPPEETHFRRAPAVTLDVIGILQAVDRMGGLQLTQQGNVRVADARRLIRTLGWKNDALDLDGWLFPDPAIAFADAMRLSGLLRPDDDRLVLASPIESFTAHVFEDQARQLLAGFLRSKQWDETTGGQTDYRRGHGMIGRLALTVALAALPPGDGFVTLNELDAAMFERIGRVFSLSFLPSEPYLYGKSPEEMRQERASWLQKLREEWLKQERPWIEAALRTWLYFLGLVEIGRAGKTITSVRLTELGRAILGTGPAKRDLPATKGKSAWVVQPTFEVVAYLDRATAEQMAFLERHAERREVQQHVASYMLTRESIYRALESGGAADAIIKSLTAARGPICHRMWLLRFGPGLPSVSILG